MTSKSKKRKPLSKFRKKKKNESALVSLFKGVFMMVFLLLLFCTLIGASGAAYIFYHYSRDLPDVRQLKNYEPSTITQLYSDQDELIAEFYIEKRIVVPMNKIPKRLIQATLAVEDSNFFQHFGVDPKAIFRALLTNIKAGRVVEGGSTITQQLSKTMFLTPQKKLERKIREAILAIRLEQVFSKEEILDMYLNQIYYGHGTYGVEAASRHYFGKSAEQLLIEECAIIAALPKAPNNYSPYRNPEKARKRRNHAIRRMAHLGFISSDEEQRALAKPIRLGRSQDNLNKAPYFVEYIRQFLQEKYGSSKLYRAGLRVYTTVNEKYQAIAERAVRKNLLINDKRYGFRGPLETVDHDLGIPLLRQKMEVLNEFNETRRPQLGDIIKVVVIAADAEEVFTIAGQKETGVIELKNMKWARPPDIKIDGRWTNIKSAAEVLTPGDVILAKVLGKFDDDLLSLALEQEPEVEGALLSIEPETGQIKALVGGYDFNRSEFNRAVQSTRQPGSAFKPIVYAAGINEGYTPATIIIDSPVIFKETEYTFDKWKPVNFENKFYGPTSLRTALTHSRNVVTIKLLQNIGVQKAISLARKLGIKSPLEQNLSIALGSSGVTLYEITGAYATFANLGKRIQPTAIRYIQDRRGNLLYTSKPKVNQVIPKGVAHIITSLLQSVVQNGTGKKVKALKRPTAGKTGTTNDFVDAWFVGFTPELVTGVWVGKDKDESLGVNETGSRAAIPIWLQYMQEALRDKQPRNFPTPEDIVFIKINPQTGKRVNFGDSQAKFEIFLESNLPGRETETSDLPATNNF
tara:strand:- start:886 stop:3294 length:2409 start_codon:yes stop_codon:yes gene_type:complete